MNFHESAEDYLEVILMLNKSIGDVRSIDIVKKLNFSKPSVSVAMKKLRQKGHIEMDKSGHIHLTPSGLEIADVIYEKHMTIAKFLMLLGVGEDNAFKDACKMEHDLSDETFSCIKDFIVDREKST